MRSRTGTFLAVVILILAAGRPVRAECSGATKMQPAERDLALVIDGAKSTRDLFDAGNYSYGIVMRPFFSTVPEGDSRRLSASLFNFNGMTTTSAANAAFAVAGYRAATDRETLAFVLQHPSIVRMRWIIGIGSMRTVSLLNVENMRESNRGPMVLMVGKIRSGFFAGFSPASACWSPKIYFLAIKEK